MNAVKKKKLSSQTLHVKITPTVKGEFIARETIRDNAIC